MMKQPTPINYNCYAPRRREGELVVETTGGVTTLISAINQGNRDYSGIRFCCSFPTTINIIRFEVGLIAVAI